MKIVERPETDRPEDWEELLCQMGLAPVDEAEVDLERAEVLAAVNAALQKDTHEAFTAPRTMEELFADIISAVDLLARAFGDQIAWTIYPVCTSGFDNVVIAVRGKRALHISTDLIPFDEYDRSALEHFLNQVAFEQNDLYQ